MLVLMNTHMLEESRIPCGQNFKDEANMVRILNEATWEVNI